ncbi:hypothetical protein PR048_010849 [Dryococelus australis]|uniref:Uncharacterized protein n=1 Tax=Dryococelus australis TaxID=614101 RepID=A0ABQ9I3V9_9NEOP|nr:hypothetical protein PR048_010849 [Dryococelus australis]
MEVAVCVEDNTGPGQAVAHFWSSAVVGGPDCQLACLLRLCNTRAPPHRTPPRVTPAGSSYCSRLFRAIEERAAREVTGGREVCDCEYQAVKSAAGRLDYCTRCVSEMLLAIDSIRSLALEMLKVPIQVRVQLGELHLRVDCRVCSYIPVYESCEHWSLRGGGKWARRVVSAHLVCAHYLVLPLPRRCCMQCRCSAVVRGSSRCRPVRRGDEAVAPAGQAGRGSAKPARLSASGTASLLRPTQPPASPCSQPLSQSVPQRLGEGGRGMRKELRLWEHEMRAGPPYCGMTFNMFTVRGHAQPYPGATIMKTQAPPIFLSAPATSRAAHCTYDKLLGRMPEIWASLNYEVLRSDEGEASGVWSSDGGNRRSPRKPTDQRHRPARFPHVKIRERPHRESNPVYQVGGEQSNHYATAVPRIPWAGPMAGEEVTRALFHKTCLSWSAAATGRREAGKCWRRSKGQVHRAPSSGPAAVRIHWRFDGKGGGGGEAKRRHFPHQSGVQASLWLKPAPNPCQHENSVRSAPLLVVRGKFREFSDLYAKVKPQRFVHWLLPQCYPTFDGKLATCEGPACSELSSAFEAEKRKCDKGYTGTLYKSLRKPAGTIPTCENVGAAPPVIERGSPSWEASSLTTTPPRPPPERTAVTERLACSAFTQVDRVQSPAESLPGSRKRFSRRSPVSPALSFRRCSILASITLIGSQDLAVKSRSSFILPNFTLCKFRLPL